MDHKQNIEFFYWDVLGGLDKAGCGDFYGL